MRWPWQREHRRDNDSSPQETHGGRREPAPSPMGWAFLPPLQRTVESPVLVTAPSLFPHSLPAWRNPSFASPDLTHAVSPFAPSGVIDGDGTGTPIQRWTPAELPLPASPRPAPVVQRSASGPAAVSPSPTQSFTTASAETLPLLSLSAGLAVAVQRSPSAPEDEAFGEAPTGEAPDSAAIQPVPDSEPESGAGPVPGHEPALTPISVDANPSSDGPLLGASPPAATPAAVQRSIDVGSPAGTMPSSSQAAVRPRYGLGAPLSSIPPIPGSGDAIAQRAAELSTPTPAHRGGIADHAPAPAASDPSHPSADADRDTLQRSAPIVAPRTTGSKASAPVTAKDTGPAAGASAGTASLTAGNVLTEASATSASSLPVAQRLPVDGAPRATDVQFPSATDTSDEQPQAAGESNEAEGASDHPDGIVSQGAEALTAEAGSPPDAPSVSLQRTVTAEEPTSIEPPSLPLAASAPAASDASIPARSLDLGLGVASTAIRSPTVQRSVAPISTRPLLGMQRAPESTLSRTPTAPNPVDALGRVAPSRSPEASPPVETAAASARTTATLPAVPSIPPTVSRAFGLSDLPTLPDALALSGFPAPSDPPQAPTVPGLRAISADPNLTLPGAPSHAASAGDVARIVAAQGLTRPRSTGPQGVDVGSLPSDIGGLPLATSPSPAPDSPAAIPDEPLHDPGSSGVTEVSIGGSSASPPAGQAASSAATSPATGASTGPSTGPSTGHGGSTDDMEALAQKLFGPMLRRIRAEMLLDRERRGLRTDSW